MKTRAIQNKIHARLDQIELELIELIAAADWAEDAAAVLSQAICDFETGIGIVEEHAPLTGYAVEPDSTEVDTTREHMGLLSFEYRS